MGKNAYKATFENEYTQLEKEKAYMESQIEQLPHTISLKINGVKDGSGELGRNTNVGITLSILDEDGNIIDSGVGTITLNGNVIFTNDLTDGTTIISGDNIQTGTINCNLLNGGVINGQAISGGTITGATISGGTVSTQAGQNSATLTGGLLIANLIRMFETQDGQGITFPAQILCYSDASLQNFISALYFGNREITTSGDLVVGTNGTDNLTANVGDFSKVYIGDNPVSSVSANCYVGTTNGLNKITGSSIRFKHDFTRDFNEELDPHRLYDVPVYQFKFQTNHLDNEKDIRYDKDVIGFITESLDRYYPVACDYDYDEKKDKYVALGWNEKYMIPPMLKLIQEQHEEIETMKDEIATLKKQVAFLLDTLKGE